MRITLVHSGALGDTVLLAPLLGALRATFAGGGGASMTLVMRPAFGQLLTMWGLAEHWSSSDDAAAARWFAPRPNDAEATGWSDCDVLISAVSNGADAWAANARELSTAKTICFFDPKPPAEFAGHVTEFQRQQLRELELVDGPTTPGVSNPDGAIVVHPGSGGEAKCWPREKYIALGRDLKRNGIIPTFILGEAEEERWGHKLVAELQEEFPWYLHVGLYELSEKLKRARLYLGNDSGISHLAAFTGVPSLVIFGPSDDRQWRPVGPKVRVVRASSGERDLAKLEVGEVLGAVMAELAR